MFSDKGSCEASSCEIRFRVRYDEVDRQNAVHNSRYAMYFEMGRTELLRQNGYDYKSLEDKGIKLVVARLEVKFRAPAGYDEELLLTTRVGKVNRAKLEHVYELRRVEDNRLIAQGLTVLAHVGADGKLTEIPKFLFPPKQDEG